MGRILFKQPNGLFGEYTYVADGFCNVNMTREAYIFNVFNNAVNNADYALSKRLIDYDCVVSDAYEHLMDYDSWIKDSDSEEEKSELIADRQKEKDLIDLTVKQMEEPVDDIKIYDDFYKELLKVVDNLAFSFEYDKDNFDVKSKDHIFVSNKENVKTMTEKLKEINKLYNEIIK